MSLLKKTATLWAFGLFRIPLILFVRPRVLRLNENECEIVIPLNYWTRNHLRSMYFGTLSIGADCAGGLIAMESIRQSGKKVSLIFKDFKAHFFRRADADVHFICQEGEKIEQQVIETLQSGERTNQTITITATCPKTSGQEPVASFELTLSLKAVK